MGGACSKRYDGHGTCAALLLQSDLKAIRARRPAMHRPIRTFAFAALLGMVASAQADTLLIERRETGAAMPHPARGALMSKVESEYGPPLHRVGPVGDPPITRWVYDNFTVYFEHSHVITTVVNKAHAEEKGPRPVN
jgi:hypothetical protein